MVWSETDSLACGFPHTRHCFPKAGQQDHGLPSSSTTSSQEDKSLDHIIDSHRKLIFLKFSLSLIIFNVSECVVVFLSSLSTRKENIIFCANHKWSKNRLFFEYFALLLGEFRSCCISDLEALSWQCKHRRTNLGCYKMASKG
jgi:hypothetical protein